MKQMTEKKANIKSLELLRLSNRILLNDNINFPKIFMNKLLIVK